MSLFTKSPIQFTGTDYLKKVASAIASRLKVKVKYIEFGSSEVTHADMNTNTVYLKEADAWLHGDDYVVGNLLHEIGHLQFTPKRSSEWLREVDAKSRLGPMSERIYADVLHSLYNMFEDRRMEVCVRKEVAGAPYYLAEFNSRSLSDLADSLEIPVPYTATDEAGVLQELGMKMARRNYVPGAGPEDVEAYYVSEKASIDASTRKYIFWRILGHVCLTHSGIGTTMTLACPEWRDASEKLVKLTHQSEKASAEDILKISLKAYEILRPWISDKTYIDNMSTAMMLKMMKAVGGHEPDDTLTGRKACEASRYVNADAQAQSKVAPLKKLLLARMRENEHMKYVGGKKKGLLDKRALSRTARDNFRVYRKREEVKGRKYIASVVLDCSGSMWQGSYDERVARRSSTISINPAMTASALIARTLRAINVPTSMSIFGYGTKTVLKHSDRYLVEEMSNDMGTSEDKYYRSGDNITHVALEHVLPQLRKSANGRHRLLFFITDGGLDTHDIERSHEMLKKEMRAGGFTPIILYIGLNKKILNDARYEREFSDVNDLVPTIVDSLKALDV